MRWRQCLKYAVCTCKWGASWVQTGPVQQICVAASWGHGYQAPGHVGEACWDEAYRKGCLTDVWLCETLKAPENTRGCCIPVAGNWYKWHCATITAYSSGIGGKPLRHTPTSGGLHGLSEHVSLLSVGMNGSWVLLIDDRARLGTGMCPVRWTPYSRKKLCPGSWCYWGFPSWLLWGYLTFPRSLGTAPIHKPDFL